LEPFCFECNRVSSATGTELKKRFALFYSLVSLVWYSISVRWWEWVCEVWPARAEKSVEIHEI
jgi:hypothetical protein